LEITMKSFWLVVVLGLVGCHSVPPVKGTGVGHAWDQAIFGADEEHAKGLQFMYKKTGDLLAEKYEGVEKSAPIDPATGEVNLEWATLRFKLMESLAADITTWEALSETVAEYSGVDLDEPADQAKKDARDRAKRFFKALKTGVKEAVSE
jgi:hypothetical protein